MWEIIGGFIGMMLCFWICSIPYNNPEYTEE